MVFPPLTEIGDNMLTNFLKWGQKRIEEIPNDDKIAIDQKDIEIGKIQARLDKFKDKMGFLETTKESCLEYREMKKEIQSKVVDDVKKQDGGQ